MFGVYNNKIHGQISINCLFLYLKFYSYRRRFQKQLQNVAAFIAFMKYTKKIEYRLAEKRKKLGAHFKKLSFFSIEDVGPQPEYPLPPFF